MVAIITTVEEEVVSKEEREEEEGISTLAIHPVTIPMLTKAPFSLFYKKEVTPSETWIMKGQMPFVTTYSQPIP